MITDKITQNKFYLYPCVRRNDYIVKKKKNTLVLLEKKDIVML